MIAHVEETLRGVELDAIRAKYAHGEERVMAMARVRDMLCDAINAPKKAMTRIVARQYGSQETKAMLSDYAIAGSVIVIVSLLMVSLLSYIVGWQGTAGRALVVGDICWGFG